MSVCMYVYLWMFVCMYAWMCVCERERKREKERKCVCVFTYMSMCAYIQSMYSHTRMFTRIYVIAHARRYYDIVIVSTPQRCVVVHRSV